MQTSNIFFHIGRYLMMMIAMPRTLERPVVYYRLTLLEVASMCLGSASIVILIASFIGAVTTVQTAYQLVSPFIPKYTIGNIVSASTLLELAPTVITFILAGRIGSSIASQIGTMRVTEQIDALEVMGINPVGYLVIPKLLGGLISFPILVTFSAFLLHLGGAIAGDLTGLLSYDEFAYGVQIWFDPHQVTVMYTKSFIFGFLITTISAYHGYFTNGGALEVGQSATKAVVYSCIAMVIADFIVAQVML